MANKSKLTKAPQWWKHLRKYWKKKFWKKERQNEKKDNLNKLPPEGSEGGHY